MKKGYPPVFHITVVCALLLITISNVNCQNLSFTRKISYANRIVAASNLSSSAFIRKVHLADTNLDGSIDAIAVGPATLLSMQRLSSTTFRTPATNWSGWGIRGIESVGFLRDRPKNATRGWYIVANSYDHITSNNTPPANQLPVGALQLIRLTGNNADPIRIATTIRAMNYHTIVGRVNGRQVKVIDINNDGFDDYIVALDGMNSINQKAGILVLYRNDGSGNFTSTILSDTLNGRIQFDIGDCDRNGFLDIAVIGLDSRVLTVFYQERNTTFTRVVTDPDVGIGNNFAITVGNFRSTTNTTGTTTFNSDIFIFGNIGMIGYVATVLNLSPTQNRTQIPDDVWTRVRVFTKNPLFTFTNLNPTLSNDYRDYSIKLMDCDGDGVTDIVTLLGKHNGVKCFRKLPDALIDWHHTMINVTSPKAMDVVDANNDGILDVLIYSETDRSIYLHLGRIV